MPLPLEDLAALSRLLDEALELGASQREAWLRALPPEQSHLAASLRDMLAARDGAEHDKWLSNLPVSSAHVDDSAVAHAGDVVGPYRLISEIGRGGMGAVWLADRADGAFKRRVALKLPHVTWAAGLAKRMARERDIGAMLEHPNIARLYDAGFDDRGRPYIAMEYIDGIPIDEWCTSRGLSVPDRLSLIVQVAKALAYAHARLVVHRDLKPSNILVGAGGQVHLLDFGIARLLRQDDGDDLATVEHSRALTPSYASPEQLEDKAVTVQSDVYSLGVLAYRLLTGTLPFQPKRKTLGAMEEAILQGDAPAPSTRVSDKPLARRLRGDIDAIVAKALRRDPKERYASAEALADDLMRCSRHEPVTARPDHAAYRVGKLMRRHWLGIAASASAMVAVQGGAGVAIVLSHRAAASDERELLARQLVQQVLRVGARPLSEDGDAHVASTTTFLERSAQLVQNKLAGQPLVQADLYAVIGQVFEEMGASRLSCEYGRLRVDALERAGADRAQHAQAALDLANVLLQDWDHDGVRRFAQRARRLAAGNPDVEIKAGALLARALWEQGNVVRSGRVLDVLERELRALRYPGSAGSVHTLWARARWLRWADRPVEAAAAFDSAIVQAVELEGQTSLTAARIGLDAAFDFAFHPGMAELTDRYLEGAVGTLRQAGAQHRLRAAVEFAIITNRRWPHQGIAFDTVRSAMAVARSEVASAPYSIPAELVVRLDMAEGSLLSRWGDLAAAEPLIERGGRAMFEAARTPGLRLFASGPIGATLMKLGRHLEADVWLRARLRAEVEDGSGDLPWAARGYINLAMNLQMMGQFVAAEEVLAGAPKFPPAHDEVPHDRYNLLLDLAASGLAFDRGDARRALSIFPMRLVDSPGRANPSPDDTSARFLLGCIQCELGRLDEGLADIRVVLGRSEDLYAHRPELAHRRAVAASYLLRAGDREAAVALARQSRESFTGQPRVSEYYKAPLLDVESKLAQS